MLFLLEQGFKFEPCVCQIFRQNKYASLWRAETYVFMYSHDHDHAETVALWL